MKLSRQISFSALLCFSFWASTVMAQETASAKPVSVVAQVSDAPPDTSDISPSTSEGIFSRWLVLDNLSFSTRYRNSQSTQGVRDFDSYQEKSLVSGRFKFDKTGKYFVGFRASSGHYFNWSYSSFSGATSAVTIPQIFYKVPAPLLGAFFASLRNGGGAPIPDSWGASFYMRELYLSASPVKQVTLEFGGLGIEHGAASEITTFDDDGYIAGERVRVKDKKHLYFDEISGTFAYFGDLYNPNFFERGTDLTYNNYRQVMVKKNWGNRISSSASFDWLAGVQTYREAALVNVSETRVTDRLRVELYQRTNTVVLPGADKISSGAGWSLAADRGFSKKRVQLEAGFADIDQGYVVYTGHGLPALFGFALNGDSYQIGKRIFARASFTPTPFITVFSFFTHEVDSPTDPYWASFNRQGLSGGVTFNFKSLLDKTSLFN